VLADAIEVGDLAALATSLLGEACNGAGREFIDDLRKVFIGRRDRGQSRKDK
jgi:hypothetical protein